MVDSGCPGGKVGFEEGAVVAIFGFEILVVGGGEGGWSGQDENAVVFGDGDGGLEYGFGTDEGGMGVFLAEIIDGI